MMHANPAGGALPPSDTASPLITRNDGAHSEAPPPSTAQRHPIKFTGSGSEYFRIWIVNLLLMLLTLGLYYPWAKVRKLKYFYNNTEVAGHALDFHGDPKRMLRGFLLTAALLLLYSFAGQHSPLAGAVAGLLLAAIWPALIRASLQFRLANTSWRGLRFNFTGSAKGVYLVFGVPVLIGIGILAGGGLLSALLVGLMPAGVGGTATMVAGALTALFTVLGFYSLIPYVLYRLKAYQHTHYALGDWQTEFRATFRDVLGIFMKTAGVSLLTLLMGGLAAGGLMAAGLVALPDRGNPASPQAFAALVPLFILMIVALQIVPLPYFQSRMQNLVWSNTGNGDLRFKSHLRFGPLLRQTALNWVLMVLTLGLYWPFAAVAMARLKLQAVSVHLRKDPDLLIAQVQPAYRDNTGDAAGDLAGIDFGL